MSTHAPPSSPATTAGEFSISPQVSAFLGALLIAGLGVFIYLPALHGQFIFDDDIYVTNNQLIAAPDGLYRFWLTTQGVDYYPISNTVLWFEWRLWGMNPTGYHVVNLLLHIAAALLIWKALQKLKIPGAFLAALLFAVHPVNVETVAWISQLKGTLAMVFSLLSVFWYLRAEERGNAEDAPSRSGAKETDGLPSGFFYGLSILAFLLAMLSKGSVAVLPLVLLGLAWRRRRRISVADVKWTLPFFVVAIALTALNVWFQTHGTFATIRSATFAQRLAGAGAVPWFYLSKALLPIELVFIYPRWDVETANPLWWLPLVAAAIVTLALWTQRHPPAASWTRSLLLFWGYFCLALAPVLGFTDSGFMRYSLVADHYQHLALIGLVALLAAAWSDWHSRTQTARRPAAVGVAVVVVAVLTLLSWQQSQLYASAATLYAAILEKNPNCEAADFNLGIIVAESGNRDLAIEYYQRALQINPDYAEAHNNLGTELLILGRPEEAIRHYRRALQVRSNFPAALANLGNALAATGHPDEAMQAYLQALKIQPNLSTAHFNLANSLVAAGRLDVAIEHYRAALRAKPDYVDAHYNLGTALARSGKTQEAITQFEAALQLKPDSAEAHNNLGNALRDSGHPQEAIEHYEAALRIKPEESESYVNLTKTYAALQRSEEAIATAQRALEHARSQHDGALAAQIEDWISKYRAQLAKPQDVAPSNAVGSPR